MNTYTITKQFLTGFLAGLTVVETTTVAFSVGDVIATSSISPSSYQVVAVKVGA